MEDKKTIVTDESLKNSRFLEQARNEQIADIIRDTVLHNLEEDKPAFGNKVRSVTDLFR